MEITPESYSTMVNHPLQSFEWGSFREKLGTKIIRFCDINSSLTMSVHKVPHLPFNIGYIPKSHNLSSRELIHLFDVGKKNNIIFIQLEPNLPIDKVGQFEKQIKLSKLFIKPAAHPLFTKYTFILDLSKSEDELLKNMHPKTRYNIRVAQKHGVVIKEDNSPKAFQEYLRLTEETTKRQKFYAHTPYYHKTLFETLEHQLSNKTKNILTSHLFTATYKNRILTAWVVFVFKDTLYYPYGASSSEARHVMASNLMMWEIIKFGLHNNLKYFDMWGALGPNADPKDPWFGFHKFKQGYGPTLTEFAGSYDLVINPLLYRVYQGADIVRWKILQLLKK
jgi:lipid II:glycine glycyltransferase (peptidoglycan interpeptide bridge formation enzyme)